MERPDLNKDITLVLDGQQRITALLIGLQGSYHYFRYNWRKEELYLNLLKKYPSKGTSDDEDQEELAEDHEDLGDGFKFRKPDAPFNKSTELWYPVRDILKSDRPLDARNKMKERLSHLSEEQRDNAVNLIDELHHVIRTKEVCSYYKEESQDPDKALQVFVRANSGGTPLGYSDLLLATATAQWGDLDARDEIHNFTDSLNTIIERGTITRRDGFFGKDFVLKACLYLCEDLDIKYQVKNFTKDNLLTIKDNWETIKRYLEATVRLILRFGFNHESILAQRALLPIAFYLLKKGNPNFHTSTQHEDVTIQVAIRKWFIFSTLRNVFGRSSDTILTRLRGVLKRCDSNAPFPADELYKSLEIEPSLTDEEIDHFLEYQHGQRYTGLVLALLCPDSSWMGGELEQDHIFPQTEFDKTKLKKRDYEEATIVEYMSCLHKIPNLELLSKDDNRSKGGKSYSDWLKDRSPDYRSRHLIPDLPDYGLDHFLEFFKERKRLMIKKLEEL